MSFKLNTLEEIKDLFAEYQPGMVVCISGPEGSIHTTGHIPWDFSNFHYSLAKTLPSIDWNHVHDKFKYMATDSDGDTYLYEALPIKSDEAWSLDSNSVVAVASGFKSFVPGNVDWKGSLVKREQIRGNRPDLFIFDDVILT